MKNITSHIIASIEEINGAEKSDFISALQAGKVRNIWADLVEESILNHTNGVYILHEDGRIIMKVYVDESIYAAELNNRRELIQLLCQERYGEIVDEFQIFISRGSMKHRYPFRQERGLYVDKRPSIALNNEELQRVEEAISSIKNSILRDKFKKAMITDLEWKKGNP